jgi:hypothetical protein
MRGKSKFFYLTDEAHQALLKVEDKYPRIERSLLLRAFYLNFAKFENEIIKLAEAEKVREVRSVRSKSKPTTKEKDNGTTTSA